MGLKESDERDAWLKKASWDVQRVGRDRKGEEGYPLSLRRREGSRQGSHGEQGYSC